MWCFNCQPCWHYHINRVFLILIFEQLITDRYIPQQHLRRVSFSRHCLIWTNITQCSTVFTVSFNPFQVNLPLLYHSWQRVFNTLFCNDPPYIAYSFLKFCPSSLSPAVIVIFFLWLNGRSRHIWCVILPNDIIDLYMSSLGTIVAKGLCCKLYATRRQLYWGLTHTVVFY